MSNRTIKRHIQLEKNKILAMFNSNDVVTNQNEVTLSENDIYESIEIDENFGHTNEKKKTLKEKLFDWYQEFHPRRDCVDGLLKILSSENLNVPQCCKTLINESKQKTIIRTVSPGTYYHLGVAKQLKKIPQDLLNDIEDIILDIGVDGLPLFKSSGTCLWPIMAKIVNIPKIDVFLIGSYVGNQKPNNVDTFLHDFAYEIKFLKEEGLNLHGKNIKISIRGFICDTPARSFLSSTVGHNSFVGCSKCYQTGSRVNNVTVYSLNSSNLRTDEDFFNRVQKEFHKQIQGDTHNVLEKLGTKMISQFPLEPMHLVDLGVAKKMIISLINNKTKTVMNTFNKNMLSKRLLELSPYIPTEFQRKTRGIEEIKRWKATEFRQLILYYGPVVFKNVVDDDFYYEILLLHVAYRLLSTPKHFLSNVEVANELLKLFVENFPCVFGDSSVTFNVHGLLHLSQCVKEYGITSQFSAYAFENFLQNIKRKIRKPTKILQQIRNRFSDVPLQIRNKKTGFKKSSNGEIRCYFAENYILSTSLHEKFCCIEPFVPIMITGFTDNCVKGIRFTNLRDFFENPCASSTIGVYVGDLMQDENEIEDFQINNIYCKMVAFPIDSSFVLMPLLHCCY